MTELKGLIKRYGITKVMDIVPGGDTGHDSIHNGLASMGGLAEDDDIVMIHDGVRPLITKELISENISAVRKYGSAITAEPVRESVVRSIDGENISEVPLRDQMYVAKAPQAFYYGKIRGLYERACRDGDQDHRLLSSVQHLS